MLQKALVLIFVVASIASFTSCGTTANHYVYATVPAANQVEAYREDPNSGVLMEIQGSPYPVGDGAHSLVLHPSGKFLYVANPGQMENDISLFDVEADGTLTEVTPRTPIGPLASEPELLAMDPAGGYLYVMNTGSNNISVFSIDSSKGFLTQVANSPVEIGLSPLNMQLTPSGNYLYVTTSGNPNGYIYAFSVSAGVLTPLPSTPTAPNRAVAMVLIRTGWLSTPRALICTPRTLHRLPSRFSVLVPLVRCRPCRAHRWRTRIRLRFR